MRIVVDDIYFDTESFDYVEIIDGNLVFENISRRITLGIKPGVTREEIRDFVRSCGYVFDLWKGFGANPDVCGSNEEGVICVSRYKIGSTPAHPVLSEMILEAIRYREGSGTPFNYIEDTRNG